MEKIEIYDKEKLLKMDLDELRSLENYVWNYDRKISKIIAFKELE